LGEYGEEFVLIYYRHNIDTVIYSVHLILYNYPSIASVMRYALGENVVGAVRDLNEISPCSQTALISLFVGAASLD
jgi:hypothetical protein